MAILNEISVGSVVYYLVDSQPNFTASTGSVAISLEPIYPTMNTPLTKYYIYRYGSWSKCLKGAAYGESYLENFTTLRDAGINTFAEVISLNAGVLDGFTFSATDRLRYTGNKMIRGFTSMSMTIRSGSAQWMDFEAGVSGNIIAPTVYQGGTGQDNAGTVQIDSRKMFDISSGTGSPAIIGGTYPNRFTVGLRYIAREGGGGPAVREHIPRHLALTVNKIDETDLLFLEDWSSGTSSTNGWTITNDTTNQWFIGSAENFGSGNNSIYISNNNGVSAGYTITTTQVSHFWRDFTFPNTSGDIFLSFEWKCNGENQAGSTTNYDYGQVYVTTTATTPVAGTELTPTTLATTLSGGPTGNGRIGANTTTSLGKFNSGYGAADNIWRTEVIKMNNYKNQTKRLVFTWVNDTSIGNNPPFVVDNIRIESY
jgi:hypothetical protein